MSPGRAAIVRDTALPLPVYRRGKVRDLYDLGDRLLVVATDRISAFDHVLPTPIPDKGRVLTALSAFWCARLDGVDHHVVAAAWDALVSAVPVLADHPELEGRTMLVDRCQRIDVECVVRGCLAGSAWEEYQRSGTVAGEPLPPGLRHGSLLPRPLFTPATKASVGHDENITYRDLAERVGPEVAAQLREASLHLYQQAARHARRCGLILADTKFEFGWRRGRLTLIDEVLTPDSSRYWDAAAYPDALVPVDKQYVRDYLVACGWDRSPPAPPLPPEVVAATRQRYWETYRRLTGGGDTAP
ncbi:MAG: phosphoribosylaminoimidazolesuccinocarboxamide synthase [Armatimonadota bacterium]|nr:phosphoribosylaminoimidazolesuccinocarboxamide synthase [Armatimonadota bacterium]MDR7403802.1 phosphoribosylaminoimidazolesuccinocarboxamide synthase [Armatimonadota bacterium]